MFTDPRLEADSTYITDLDLCQVRLNHNAAFPWILLIPRQPDLVEIIDLSARDQQVLMQDIVRASKVMKQLFNPTKINVASLGNVVPQLHVHIIARYQSDSAWPGPVWNSGRQDVYDPSLLRMRVDLISQEILNF